MDGQFKMKKIINPLSYFIYTVPDHKLHKKNILKLIEKIKPLSKGMEDNSNYINHTDWNLPKETKREYLDYFYENIMSTYADWFIKEYKLNKYLVNNAWYQQYNKNNFHNYHTHENTNFTNVYFLELPKKEMATEIKNLDHQIVNLNVKEGQIISFPGFILHRSKIIKNNLTKTIISFNSNFVRS